MMKFKLILIVMVLFVGGYTGAAAQDKISFKDDFEKRVRNTGKWDLVNAPKIQVEDSGDSAIIIGQWRHFKAEIMGPAACRPPAGKNLFLGKRFLHLQKPLPC